MLNENIKRLRKSKGLSQEELAIKLHVVRQTVSKWENGLCFWFLWLVLYSHIRRDKLIFYLCKEPTTSCTSTKTN